MTPRFPKVCFRCGGLDHYSEDCTRMPAGLGMSAQERAMVAAVRRDRATILWAAASMVLALVLSSWLELPL